MQVVRSACIEGNHEKSKTIQRHRTAQRGREPTQLTSKTMLLSRDQVSCHRPPQGRARSHLSTQLTLIN
ncbi:hypothetical protein BKA81DRAFT_348231 [Phyllosticta paracitricarpa]